MVLERLEADLSKLRADFDDFVSKNTELESLLGELKAFLEKAKSVMPETPTESP